MIDWTKPLQFSDGTPITKVEHAVNSARRVWANSCPQPWDSSCCQPSDDSNGWLLVNGHTGEVYGFPKLPYVMNVPKSDQSWTYELLAVNLTWTTGHLNYSGVKEPIQVGVGGASLKKLLWESVPMNARVKIRLGRHMFIGRADHAAPFFKRKSWGGL